MASTDATKCNLHIPFKDCWLQVTFDEDGNVDQESFARAAAEDFENWKAVELWANYIGPQVCDCANTNG